MACRSGTRGRQGPGAHRDGRAAARATTGQGTGQCLAGPARLRQRRPSGQPEAPPSREAPAVPGGIHAAQEPARPGSPEQPRAGQGRGEPAVGPSGGGGGAGVIPPRTSRVPASTRLPRAPRSPACHAGRPGPGPACGTPPGQPPGSVRRGVGVGVRHAGAGGDSDQVSHAQALGGADEAENPEKPCRFITAPACPAAGQADDVGVGDDGILPSHPAGDVERGKHPAIGVCGTER